MTTPRKYVDVEELFELQVPSDWLANTSGQAGTRVAFVSPEVVMGFQANLNVVIQHVPPLTKEEFLTLSRLQLKMLAGRATLPVDAPADEPPITHVFEWVNNQTPVPLRMRQQLFFSGKKAFILTATALESNFEEYRPAFDSTFRSFRIKDEM